MRRRGEVAGAAGLEPATGGLENRCSVHLSYAPVPVRHSTSHAGPLTIAVPVSAALWMAILGLIWAVTR